MTTNAVNWKSNELRRNLDKEIADLDRQVDFKKLGISESELKEKIRHNQVEEYLNEKKVNADDRNGFISALGTLLRGATGFGSGIGKLAAANDESWHNKLTVAYDQATNLPFSEKAGNPHNLNKIGFDWMTGATGYQHFNSGIIHLRYIPTIAVTDQEVESSELQNNVRILFTKVRQANSGAVNNYDQSDLFQFTLCSSNVFEIIRLLVRPINYLNAIRKPMNSLSAWDKHMLTIMCGNTTNANFVINNRTNIVQAINSCIRSANAQILPIGFDLTRRRSLLNGRIFTHDGARDEIYVFSPSIYYTYDEANAKAKANVLNLQTVFSSIDNIRSLLLDMLTPLINGTATSIMAGDMYKAFPKQVSRIREVPYTTKGDIYSSDENILNAIMNANVVDVLLTSQLDVNQGVNAALDTYIYQGVLQPNNKCRLSTNDASVSLTDTTKDDYQAFNAYWISRGFTAGDKIYTRYQDFINVKKDKPEKYDIMSATRFKVGYYQGIKSVNIEGTPAYGYESDNHIYQWGSEIINDIEVYGFNTEANYNLNLIHDSLNGYSYNRIALNDWRPVNIVGVLTMSKYYSRFHYLPSRFNLMCYTRESGGYPSENYDAVHSFYNIRLLNFEELMHLHNASFGSLISIKDSAENDPE